MSGLVRKSKWRAGENLTGDLEFFTAFTLVDITDSGISDPELFDSLEYNQSQNLNVLLQVIGLRTQPVIVSVTARASQDLTDYDFGTAFTGTHTVWAVKFASEYRGAWEKNGDPIYFLKSDTDGIAFIPELDNTVEFLLNVFDSYDATNKNIYFLKSDTL